MSGLLSRYWKKPVLIKIPSAPFICFSNGSKSLLVMNESGSFGNSIQMVGENIISGFKMSTTEQPCSEKCKGTSMCVPEWLPKDNRLVLDESPFTIDLT